MSTWAHVAAVVRIDDFRFSDDQPTPDWDEIFGKECRYNAPRDVWEDHYEHPEKYLPCGSEGSLRKTAWVNPDSHNVAAYTVTIFGDLRDYDSPEEIVEWFKKIVNPDGIEAVEAINVRQACITVTNYYNSIVWGINFGEEVANEETGDARTGS